MRILAVGGGSGGHVTPVVAVLKEIKREAPEAELRFWCDFKFAPQARAAMAAFDKSIPVSRIAAGKFRRYNHVSALRQLFWGSVVVRNFGDLFLVGAGFLQSIWKLLLWRPDVVFTKGGFVCLPVGLAARLLRVPLVIHDSDAHPGLTNRILARYANAIATGAPLEFYRYPKSKTHYVGIPVAAEFHPVTPEEQLAAKKAWGLDQNKPLVVITGGGLGAERLNNATVEVLPQLLEVSSVVLAAGAGQYDELRARTPANNERFQMYPFVTKMASLLTAADVVVARAGATTILELAALAKPTILVPNAKLTGGHQVKNAAVYVRSGAVKEINDEALSRDSHLLLSAVAAVLDDPQNAQSMAHKFHDFARPNAARDMADIILSFAR